MDHAIAAIQTLVRRNGARSPTAPPVRRARRSVLRTMARITPTAIAVTRRPPSPPERSGRPAQPRRARHDLRAIQRREHVPALTSRRSRPLVADRDEASPLGPCGLASRRRESFSSVTFAAQLRWGSPRNTDRQAGPITPGASQITRGGPSLPGATRIEVGTAEDAAGSGWGQRLAAAWAIVCVRHGVRPVT